MDNEQVSDAELNDFLNPVEYRKPATVTVQDVANRLHQKMYGADKEHHSIHSCPNCGRVVSMQFISGVHRYAVHDKPSGIRCWYSFDPVREEAKANK